MKKVSIILLPFLFISCFGPGKDEIQKAKDELLDDSKIQKITPITETPDYNITENNTSPSEEKSYYSIQHLTGDTFLSIDPILNIEKITDTLDIVGKVSNTDIEKIKVSFKNETSKFPVDTDYELKTFKKGNSSFLYRAHKKFQVLDYGLNIYTIDGYVANNLVSRIELKVFIVDPKKINSLIPKENPLGNISFSGDILENLPSDENSYGTSSQNGDDTTITYSNISNFTLYQTKFSSGFTCENFADYLKENYTWYYWNTCRPITNESNFSVYVLSLTGDEYRYEKHYIIGKYSLYGKMLLESGNGVKSEDLPLKNDELKKETFVGIDLADKLMRDILR